MAAPSQPGIGQARGVWPFRARAGGALLILAVLLVYAPVWRNGFVWDDRSILTANPCIVGPLGFRQIWTTHHADLCPLTLSALWLEHALWGLSPAPYHVVNVLLHAVNALGLWRVLRGLRVPGAWLGAALWALHPVEAASVAWVAELKNTLSGAFFLGSVLCFLHRLREGETRRSLLWYGTGLLCAAAAMASKSAAVVLLPVLVLCVWWVEGRVAWRRIIALGPLVPMAAAASLLTLWTQRLALAGDTQWARPWPARLAAAGEAVWFYLGKLFWPHPLAAVYPRWQVDAARWHAWLPLLAVVVVAALLWRRRGTAWGRAGGFAFGFFLAALVPALGLFDGADFRYSLVFDHFQYLASMGPLALAGAGLARLHGRPWRLAAGTVLLTLGALTWQRAAVYQDEKTFWTDTVAKNPDGWLGHGNLGSVLLSEGQVDAARSHYERALAINPRYAEAHNNLGIIFLRLGDPDAAIAQVEQAVAIRPDYADARSNLGNALAARGRMDEAIAQYEQALAINPGSYLVHFNLGNALAARGDPDDAVAQYEDTLAINPGYAEAHNNLGNMLLAARRLDEAIAHYERALALRPGYAEAHNNLGITFMRKARFDDAAIHFQEALRLAPDHPDVRANLAAARTLARRAHPAP